MYDMLTEGNILFFVRQSANTKKAAKEAAGGGREFRVDANSGMISPAQSPQLAVGTQHGQSIVRLKSASLGDKSAILEVCKMAGLPGWDAVDSVAAEPIIGGASGASVFKVTAQMAGDGRAAAVPQTVVFRVAGGDEDARKAATAMRIWKQDPGLAPHLEDHYMLLDPRLPAATLTEWLGGGCLNEGSCQALQSTADAAAFGKAVGRLHAQPTSWYDTEFAAKVRSRNLPPEASWCQIENYSNVCSLVTGAG